MELHYTLIIACGLVVQVLASENQCSPETSSVGKEFLFGLINFKWLQTITVSIAANQSGNVHVRAPAAGVDVDYPIRSGKREFHLPTQIIQSTHDAVENKAVHLLSDVDISVNVMMSGAFWEEGFLVLPIRDSSKQFVIATPKVTNPSHPAEFLVAALKDNTTISIEFPSTKTLNMTLNSYQTYQFQSTHDDLTGTYIQSSSPVSVVAGNMHTYFTLLLSAGYASFFVEQMPSADYFGSHFIIPALPGISHFIVTVLVPDDNIVNITYQNSSSTYHFKASRHFPLQVINHNEPVYIISDSPALVSMYSMDATVEQSGGGGEFMWIVPSISSYMAHYDFFVPTAQSAYSNYMLVVSPTQNISDVRLDSGALSTTRQSHIHTTMGEFTTLYMSVSSGKHTASSTSGNTQFGAFVYGRGYGRGYGFPLGLKIVSEECSASTTPTPTPSLPIGYI